MKYKKISFFLIALVFVLSPFYTLAYGDGYYDCERDQIYERNDKGEPTMGLRLRQRACMTDSEVLKVLPEGREIEIIAETDGWYKVRDSAGAVGWVGARLVQITQKGNKNNRLSGEHFYLNVGKEVSNADREKMVNRVRGRILLAVESRGEAWYVDPASNKRIYMKDGNAAFSIMRNMGLGISNANFTKLEGGDLSLRERLSGKIVLRVEALGEAYYIDPTDKQLHYLKNGQEAYRIMRELGLGISNNDLSIILED